MIDWLKRDYGFPVLILILLFLFLVCSCEKSDPLFIEDKITAVEPADDGRSSLITVGERTFLFTDQTFYIDSWGGYLAGRENVSIDESIVGRYCLAGWGINDDSRLLLLDVSGWQQPLFKK